MAWSDYGRHKGGVSLKSGNWVRQPGALNGMQLTALRCYWTPLDLERQVAIDGIGTYNNISGGVGKLFRFMVYADTDGVPGALLLDAGTTSAHSTGERSIVVSDYKLSPGRVWLAVVSDGDPQISAFQSPGAVGDDFVSVTNSAKSCYIADLASIAAPSPAPAVSTGPLTAPCIAVSIV